MTDLGSLERYRPLVDRWPEFAEASRRPLAPCVWANPLRTGAAGLARWLAAAGVAAEPVPWLPDAFVLPAETSPGRLLAFAAGLLHVQEAVSSLPVRLLGARSGERVLDLCAAPGGKTAGIAAAVGPGGLVVANDRDRGRLGPLRRTLARLGLTNVAVTAWNAASYPRAAGRFDRVLADVPCSCEGTSRKNPEVLARGGDRERLVALQTEILASAVRRCRPGGRVVYSTCTYAPEENEGVVDDILRSRDDLAVRPVRRSRELPGLCSEGGLASWRGRRFAPALAGALRVWPHHNDTGGFFVAVLEKSDRPDADDGPPRAAVDPAWPAPWRQEPADRYLAPMRSRFGLPPELFAAYRLVARGRKRLSVTGAVPELAPAAPEMLTVGLPFVRIGDRERKMSTAAAMTFGTAATRNRVGLDAEAASRYLARRPVPASSVVAAGETSPGWVMVEHRGAVLGVGRLLGDGSLASLYPKAWSRADGLAAGPAGRRDRTIDDDDETDREAESEGLRE